MKKIFLLFILIFVTGCTQKDDTVNKDTVKYEIYEKIDHNGDKTKYVNFGSYPQTVVMDDDIIDELNTIKEVNGYYTFNNKDYVKMTADVHTETIFNNGNNVIHNKVYYFEVQEIVWRIENDLFISEYILDSRRFDTKSNVYEESSLRNYLNNSFLNNFTLEELNTMKVNLSGDKVSILSLEDIESKNKDYKKSLVSDYAIANYCKASNRYGEYWLSTPMDNENGVRTITETGETSFVASPNVSYVGIKPVIQLISL